MNVQIIITSISSRKDGSVGFRGETPKFNDEQFSAFRKLQNQVVVADLKPLEGESADIIEVKTELDEKTPSQRLRGVLFVLYKQQYMGKYPTFHEFYEKTMESFIDQCKSRLD